MNFRQIFTILSKVASFIGLSMILSLPWAFSPFGGDWFVESRGFWGLLFSIVISLSLGAFLKKIGEKSKEIALQKKESMAAVPLSWILAIFLASLPYLLSRTETTPGHPMTIPDTLFEATSG